MSGRHGPPAGRGDRLFHAGLLTLLGGYLLLIVAMLAADATYTTPAALWKAWQQPEIRAALRLSLWTSTFSTLLAVVIGTPIAYALARLPLRGKVLWEAVLDIPLVLPPLVIGLSLLILFRSPPGRAVEAGFQALFGVGITYDVPAIVIAQTVVVCAFVVRTMRATFDQLDVGRERVALTLGADERQAFLRVALPEAWRGLLSAATLAWARALGEFGPILIFAGATRMKTEVLPTTIYLELDVGRIESAVAVSLLMVGVALVVLVLTRWLGGAR